MRAPLLVPCSLLLAVCWSSPAEAQPLRLHGTAAAARATGGHQKDEFGWGAGAWGAAELGLTKAFGIELELGGLWLSEGDDPADPRFAPQGDSAAALGGVGVRVRPFATSYAGTPFSSAGLWASANGGIALTGGLTRPMFDAQLGYDLLYSEGRVGVGPMLGYLHVFQADSELRPADANLLLLGIHVMFDTAKTPLSSDGDRDGDGIKDSLDKCPDDPEDKDGFEDEDGCPDNDNDRDGILDRADSCPNDPEDIDGFEDQDGCPEKDNDKDGLLDPQDKCPNDAEDIDGFEDEDGCPEKDNDKDGILDPNDVCPNEPETKNGYADHDGCPDEEQVRVVGDKIVLDDRVHFRTNSAIIRVISYPLLERLGKLIKEHAEYVHIDIEGHADERGPESYNQRLSEDRANSVLEFLVKHGVARGRLSSKGFGTTQPLVPKSSEHAWLMNRRVEFRVTRELKYIGQQAVPPASGAVPTTTPAATPPASSGQKDDEAVVAPEDTGDPEAVDDKKKPGTKKGSR